MKKALKLASALLAGVLALGLVACSSGDDSSDDGDDKKVSSTAVRSATTVATSTSVALAWKDPEDTSDFGGVKITWGDTDDKTKTVEKGTNTCTVTDLEAEKSYTFNITSLDSSNKEKSDSTVSLKITTPAITYKEKAESLTVGSKVTVGDATYYVISNQLGTTSAKSSPSASVSARAAVATADESTDTASSDTTESDEDEETTTEITGTADLTDTTSATTIDTGTPITDKIIVKFASDAYVRKILKEVGITKYIQLYNLESRPSTITTNDSSKESYLVDRFLIADESGNKIAEFKQQFSSTYFVPFYVKYVKTNAGIDSTKSAERGKYFASLDPDTLRQTYEPNQFDVTTYEDGVQNNRISKIYKYDKYGEVGTNKANLDHVNYYRHPTKIDKTTVYPYVYKNKNSDEEKRVEYVLANTTKGSQYYTVASYKNIDSNGDETGETRVQVTAQGTSASDTSSSSRKNQIELYFNRVNSDATKGNVLYINARLGTDAIFDNDDTTANFGDTISETNETSQRIQVTLKTLASSTTTQNLLDQSVTVKVNGSDVKDGDKKKSFKLSEAISEYLSDYIQVSSETTTVNNYIVPSEIYVRANLPSTYTAVAGHDFLNVVLVPVAVGTDSIKYVAVYDSTTGADAFDSAFSDESAIAESSYVPSFATLYKENITKVADGTYTDTITNPFPATTTTSE